MSVFGLTEARRKDVLEKLNTTGLAVRCDLAVHGRHEEHDFVCTLCDIAKRALSDPPLNERVDFLTAMKAAADGYKIEFKNIAGKWVQSTVYHGMRQYEYRVLPKPAPKPKLISNREALYALVVEGKAVRRWMYQENGPHKVWVFCDASGPVGRSDDSERTLIINVRTWFNLELAKWFLCDEKTGEALETE